MTKQDEAELIAQVEDAKAKLRTSLKKSRALVVAYRARLGALAVPPGDQTKSPPVFRFKR